MDPKRRAVLCSKGGKRAHQLAKAHEWTSEEARAAGRKGGLASGEAKRTQQAA